MHGPGLRPRSVWPAGPAGESPSPRIYFARAIDGEDHAARLALTAAVAADLAAAGLSMVDPTADEPAGTDAAGQDERARYRAIVEHDLAVLKSCHAVLMDISVPGRSYIGCICEMTYAHFWQIPCVVYVGGVDQHRPWLHYHAAAIFEARAEAIDWLRELFTAEPTADPADGR